VAKAVLWALPDAEEMGPPIEVFLTTIASQAALRKKQEYLLRTLQVKKIEFTSFDLASDEEAKKRWRRRQPQGKYEVPGILVGGKYPGDFEAFEDAAEHDELAIFLRLNDKWDPIFDGDQPVREPKPIGVPGAHMPSVMNKDHKPSYSKIPAPPPDKKREEEEFDISAELSGFGLQGVKMTNNELQQLAQELGLDEEAAADLTKGLGSLDLGESGKEGDVKGKDIPKESDEPTKEGKKDTEVNRHQA